MNSRRHLHMWEEKEGRRKGTLHHNGRKTKGRKRHFSFGPQSRFFFCLIWSQHCLLSLAWFFCFFSSLRRIFLSSRVLAFGVHHPTWPLSGGGGGFDASLWPGGRVWGRWAPNLVGRHRNSSPGPPACESGVYPLRYGGRPLLKK